MKGYELTLVVFMGCRKEDDEDVEPRMKVINFERFVGKVGVLGI